MKNLNFKEKYCYFLIWGTGLQYSKEIINQIRDDDNFDILKIKYHEVKNVKKLVKQIYSQDYAPLKHLKEKTKYLLQSEPRVLIIFALNKNHQEKIFGKKEEFKHIECEYIKQFKGKVRDQFNPPPINGKKSHEHIIHASDSEYQVDHLLKLVGYTDGIKYLSKKPNSILPTPHHTKPFKNFLLKKVDINSLYCYLYKKDSKSIHKEKIELINTPHYKYVTGYKDDYLKYINTFGGITLTDDHFIENYEKLKKDFSYLREKNPINYIIVEEFQLNNFMILDGVHRACILKQQGEKTIIVTIIKD